MTYPDEISSTPKATAAGTAYHEVEVYPFGVTDKMLMLIPDSISEGDNVIVTICAHGSGGNEQTVNTANMSSTRDALLGRGYVVLSAYAHNRAWGNNACLDDYERVYEYAATLWTITDVFYHGQSMGGLILNLMLAQARIPNVRALAMVDGAVHLEAAWNHPAHHDHIRTAYGIKADGSDYAAKTAGHDPCLLPPTQYEDTWIYMWASYDDTSVPRAEHADVFETHVAGHPDELTVQAVTGGHVSASHYQPDVLLAFYDRSIGLVPDNPPDLLVTTTRRLFIGGAWDQKTIRRVFYEGAWSPTASSPGS